MHLLRLCALVAATPGMAQDLSSAEQLGAALFQDTNLSANRTMACATCHTPQMGFVDPRVSEAGRAASLGDDGVSIGDRNAPTAGYAQMSPPFGRDAEGEWVGGQFWDGRAHDLQAQAGGPPLNPIEMGMPSKATVADRLRESAAYLAAFESFYGAETLADDDALYDAMTDAIAKFEQTAEFAPFDSKYDRFLRGETKLTDQEELGRVLFFSEQFTNCNLCHMLRTSPVAEDEVFSNYAYHNIGVPENTRLRAITGVKGPDHGLLANPLVDDPAMDGRFKVPSLRNVAVTGPYMHNGVFEDLRTVVLFYNKYNSINPARQINPETDAPWRAPEVPGTLSLEELEHGPALDDRRVDALVAFMRTLTDARYEDLLPELSAQIGQ